MMDFFQNVPKIELHAHLNGSLSNRTLLELGAMKYGKDNPGPSNDECFYRITNGQNLTLKECFQKFKYAHDLTDQPETLRYATRAVIQDFAADNVVYLELRTTPKKTVHMSKKQYLTTVLETIRTAQNEIPSITVKLLPSIDRSKGLQEAEENVSLVIELCQEYPDIIKGMDLSGAPFGTRFSDFGNILKKAQAHRLKMALHCGEFEDDDEIQAMLEFGTDRIGHGTFIKGVNLQNAKKRGIPFECCLTSNVKCSTASSYEEHHFKKLWEEGFAVCICTDDFGVFDTSLTQELRTCSEIFGLTTQDILRLQENTIRYTYANDEEKHKLTEIFNNFRKTMKID
ncbi:adenosine deaminase-like protein [Malaya genurostris]|uniref:adenosine deaminase-like protein n=1 Tax=Malaya genurostris TaxID=325434 RepID=UPI0026F3C2BE|nr:adenosine deaminase-like protein [Malaya genurostris]